MNFKWLFIALAILYVIWPLDVLPDVIPVIGWIDDLIVILLAIYYAR